MEETQHSNLSSLSQTPHTHLTNFVAKNAIGNKCSCPIFCNSSKYYKKHFCMGGKRRRTSPTTTNKTN